MSDDILVTLDRAWNEDFKANLMHYCDLAAQEIRKLRKERDEAKGEVVQTQDELGALLHAAEAERDEARKQLDCEQWQPPETIPQIGTGHEREYVIAIYRKRSDKVYSFAASYLNAVPLSYDDCPFGEEAHKCKHCTDDGCPTTGWYRLTGENGEGGSYDGIDLRDGDKLVGWRELPRWEVTHTDEIQKADK